MKNAPEQEISPDVIDSQFRHVTLLHYHEIQLLKEGRYQALALDIRRRLARVIVIAAAVVFCLAAISRLSSAVLVLGGAIMACVFLWVGPGLYRLHKIRLLILNYEDPQTTSDPAEFIEAEFRRVTTLMFHEIQLLKARRYGPLLTAMRARLGGIVSLSVVLAMKLALPFQVGSDRWLMSLGLVVVTLAWALPRFHRLNRLELLTRRLGSEHVRRTNEAADAPVRRAWKHPDALAGKVDGKRDLGPEGLQAEIRQTFTLSYADIQRLKAGEYVQVLRKLRCRRYIHYGLGVCTFATMAWAFRDELIGLIIALALMAALLASGMKQLRRIARWECAADRLAAQETPLTDPLTNDVGNTR